MVVLLSFLIDGASWVDWYCEDRYLQGTCPLWSRLVLYQSWYVFHPLSLCVCSCLCLCLYHLELVDWLLIICMIFLQTSYLILYHSCILQLPWRGRYTWGEVLVLAPFRRFMVDARGMEAVHPISAKAVVVLLVTSFNSCKPWTLLIWTQRGELVIYFMHLSMIYGSSYCSAAKPFEPCFKIVMAFICISWYLLCMFQREEDHIKWPKRPWPSCWTDCSCCSLNNEFISIYFIQQWFW